MWGFFLLYHFFVIQLHSKIYIMTLEAFKKVVSLLKKNSERDDKFYKLGIDIINLQDELHGVINILLKSHYSEEGEDMISWWLWESTEKFLYNEAGEKTNDLTEVEAIWKYVEEIRKSPDFKEYIPVKKRRRTKKQLTKLFVNMFHTNQ